MAKRRTAEQPEIVQQLRPDDSGWLAELRRARTEPIDLAPGPDDDLDQSPDPSEPPKSERTEPAQSEPTEPAQSERTEPASEADPTPLPEGDTPLESGKPPPQAESGTPPPQPAGSTPSPPAERDAPPPPLAPPAAPSHGPPSDPGPQRPTPLPTWNRPTPPPARSRPLPPPPARPLVAQPHHVDVTPEPALRPARHPRGPGLRRNDKRHRSFLRRWDIVLPMLALVVGATIGLTWRGTDTPGPDQPVENPVSMASPPGSSPTELPQSIVVTSIRYDGDSITLSWIDPTAGQALFVISQILSDDTDARFVRSLPAGQSEVVITGLDPNASQYCYRVFAVQNGGAVARSATTCTQKRDSA